MLPVRRPARIPIVGFGSNEISEVPSFGREDSDVPMPLPGDRERDPGAVRGPLRREQLHPVLELPQISDIRSVRAHHPERVHPPSVSHEREAFAVGRQRRIPRTEPDGDPMLLLRLDIVPVQIPVPRAVLIRRAPLREEHRFPIRRPRDGGGRAAHRLLLLIIQRQDEQPGAQIIAPLVRQICEPTPIRRPRGMRVRVSLIPERIALHEMLPNRRDLALILLIEMRPPPSVQLWAGYPQRGLQRPVEIRPPPPRCLLEDLPQLLFTVLLHEIEHQRISVVVHHLAAQTGLLEHPHLVVGQGIAVQCGHTEDHIPMRIPSVVLHAPGLILGGALREPHRHDRRGDRIRRDHVRIAGQHILPVALLLVSEVLEKERGHPPGPLPGDLQRDRVRELVCDHVPQPIARTPELVIQIRRPDLDPVIVVIREPVGDIIRILKHQSYRPIRLEPV